MSAPTLSTARMHARYRLGPSPAPGMRERLDAMLGDLAGGALEPALARLDLDPDELVCIRSLHARVQLRAGATDAAGCAEWGTGIAAAIAAALAGGGDQVVRYRSTRAALADFGRSVVTGSVERAWAWRQLGLWRATAPPVAADAPGELLGALAREPEAIAPLVAHLAAAGLLPALTTAIGSPGVAALAVAALRAAGVSESGSAAALEPRPAPGAPLAAGPGARFDRGVPGAAEAAGPVASIAAGSAVFRGAVAARSAGAPLPVAALAALAVAEREPALLGAAPGRAPDLVAGLAGVLRGALAAGEPAPPVNPPPRARPRDRDPERPRHDVPPGSDDARTGAAADAVHGGDDPRDPADGPARDAARSGAPPPDAGAARDETGVTDDPPRTGGWSALGGVMFLLHVVDELGLAATLASEPPLAARGSRWILHRLARELSGAGADDPAALAFAGLAPGDEPPGGDAPDVGAHERAALAAAAMRVAARLVERLDRPGEEPADVLAHTCRRRAEIVADPGWIDCRLALEDVDVGLRRAGLDLDPGYLPWLGAVVRFVYG